MPPINSQFCTSKPKSNVVKPQDLNFHLILSCVVINWFLKLYSAKFLLEIPLSALSPTKHAVLKAYMLKRFKHKHLPELQSHS